MKRLLFLVLVLDAAASCSDALEQDTTTGQVVAVVNSGDQTMSCVDATAFAAACLTDLAPPTGTPTTLDARGSVVIVALGQADALRVVSFGTLPPTSPPVVSLAPGSGATGVVMEDDSIAWVGNPGLNTVTRVNYRTGDTLSRPAGKTPQAVAIAGGRLFALNGDLTGGTPAGPSWVTRYALPYFPGGVNLNPDSIGLTGANARYAVAGADGLLYIVMAGTVGKGDGRLSIVDPAAGVERAVVNGLGESPGPAVYHASGRLLMASVTEGILEISTLTRSVTRGPGDGVKPGGDGVSALAVDQRGRVYALSPGNCTSPGVVHVLSAPPDYRELRSVTVGICPTAAALAFLPLVP